MVHEYTNKLCVGAAVSAALIVAGCQTTTGQKVAAVAKPAACLAATAREQQLKHQESASLGDVLAAGIVRAAACAETNP